MKTFFLIPRARWVDLSPQEAMELGLEQAGRWQWQMYEIVWLNLGLGLKVRAKALS